MTAYASPAATHDPTTGQVIPAAWGDAVNAAVDYQGINRPHCRLASGNQTITTATRTAVLFTTERLDVGALHSTSSNTSRITIVDAGFYGLSCSDEWVGNATGYRNIEWRLNGASLLAVNCLPTVTVNTVQQSVTTFYYLAAGDYVEVTVYQTSGGNLVLAGNGPYSPEAEAIWMCQ